MRKYSFALALGLLLIPFSFSTVYAQSIPNAEPIEFRVAQAQPAAGLIQIDCGGMVLYAHPNAALTGKDFTRVDVVPNPKINAPSIQISLTTEGSIRLEGISMQNMGKHLVLLLNGKAAAGPIIKAPLRNKVFMELPDYPVEELHSLAATLNPKSNRF